MFHPEQDNVRHGMRLDRQVAARAEKNRAIDRDRRERRALAEAVIALRHSPFLLSNLRANRSLREPFRARELETCAACRLERDALSSRGCLSPEVAP